MGHSYDANTMAGVDRAFRVMLGAIKEGRPIPYDILELKAVTAERTQLEGIYLDLAFTRTMESGEATVNALGQVVPTRP